MNWYFDEENTKIIMLHTGMYNAKDMVETMYERFGKYKDFADFHIKKWYTEKEIDYSYDFHYLPYHIYANKEYEI